MVDILCVLGDYVAADLAHHFENLVVAVLCVGIVLRRVVEFIGVGEVALLESYDLLHHRVREIVLQRLVVCIEISHYFVFFL